jgi:hypothetical protein
MYELLLFLSAAYSDHPRLLQKFMREGCPNCENTLQLRGNNDAIQECTSQVFEGLIAVRDPAVSWVARWQRLDNYVPGTYATKVTGSVSKAQNLEDISDGTQLPWNSHLSRTVQSC